MVQIFSWKSAVALPIISTLTAFALFTTLIVKWGVDGHRRFTRGSTIPYVSDVGAVNEGIFIPLGAVVAVSYVASIILDFVLRRHYLIAPHRRRQYEKPIAIGSIIAGIISAIGLILLTIFNDMTHDSEHWAFSLVFFVGLAVSAALKVSEIGLLSHDHFMINHLRRSYRTKIVLVGAAVVLLIAFLILTGVCDKFKNQSHLSPRFNAAVSTAAVCEWSIAFLYVGYLATLIVDLWPSTRHQRPGDFEMEAARQMAQAPKPPTIITPPVIPASGTARV